MAVPPISQFMREAALAGYAHDNQSGASRVGSLGDLAGGASASRLTGNVGQLVANRQIDGKLVQRQIRLDTRIAATERQWQESMHVFPGEWIEDIQQAQRALAFACQLSCTPDSDGGRIGEVGGNQDRRSVDHAVFLSEKICRGTVPPAPTYVVAAVWSLTTGRLNPPGDE